MAPSLCHCWPLAPLDCGHVSNHRPTLVDLVKYKGAVITPDACWRVRKAMGEGPRGSKRSGPPRSARDHMDRL
jgi:hypothetical protein